MIKFVNTKTIKVIFNEREIIGDRASALFAQPLDASIEIPDPSHVMYEIQPTTHGNRARIYVNDSDRTLTIPVVIEEADDAIKIINSYYEDAINSPLKIISIGKGSEGYVLAEYDSAMLTNSPTVSTISSDFSVFELNFTVGVQVK